MNTSLSLLFYLKKPQNYVSGAIPVYLRITVNGRRAEVSTCRECHPDNWNAAAGKGKGQKEEIKALNVHLDILKAKAYEAQHLLLSVSKMLGYRNLRTTQHYAKILDKKVSEDMQCLRMKIAASSNEKTISSIGQQNRVRLWS
ncbi:MAG: hypothetical protein Q8928_17740 [Bacteroidota bacterium]|nr:hypothetical protein [Bacteroidota bacterium]